MSTNRIHRYDSDDIQVQYDVKRCIHAAECIRRLNSVFDAQKRPWIQPTNASADAVAETIPHCPSGALHYTRKDGGADEAIPAENRISVAANGPLYARGRLSIQTNGETVTETRTALCRCGASSNKPYCDNTHLKTDFTDPAAINVMGEPIGTVTSAEGELTIAPQTNGPIQVLGSMMIEDAAGTVVYRDEAYLCRCGGSANKPFCDGTHERIGFIAD